MKSFYSKSLYYIFNDNKNYYYSKDLVDAIFMSFKGEEKLDLIRRYGTNLISSNIPQLEYKCGLWNSLSNIIHIFLIRLHLASNLLQNNMSLDDITDHFRNEELSRKRIVARNNFITNCRTLRSRFECSEEELDDALELVEDSDFRNVIRYTYGIKRKVWNKETICEVFKIDDDFHESIIIYFACILDSLIEKVRNDLETNITGNKSKKLII